MAPIAAAAMLFVMMLGAFPAFADASNIWIEGESFSSVSPDTIKATVDNDGTPAYLSGGKWLHISVDAGNVDTAVPDTGVLVAYKLMAPADGTYQIWARLGYEKVRSPFDWKIDDGAWQTVGRDVNTVDVEELQVWNPIGWLNAGSQHLSAGTHTLTFRVNKNKTNGKTDGLVFACDAINLTTAPFHPNGPINPTASDWMTASDKAAATHVFNIDMPASSAQTATSLAGDWQITPDDELVVDDRLGPTKALPSDLDSFAWQSISVPSDRNDTRSELSFVHRYYLRTHVNVPASEAGHAVYLHFPSINMVATVFVNGQQCGYTRDPFAGWDCDITNAVKSGQVNEIVVGIKDVFYALDDGESLTHPQYLPFSFWHYNEWTHVDMPVLSHFENGILRTPSLVVAGKTYTSDVFARPSVTNKTLTLDITVHNPSAQAVTVSVANDIVPLTGGNPEKTFTPKDVDVPAGQDAVVTVSEPWSNPKLWWPDDPQQYNALTRLSVDGKVIDERSTKFGFREWGWQGANFTLNGVPWHFRADTANLGTGDDMVKNYRAHGQSSMRIWGEGGDKDAELNFYDANGITVRRTGIFDGEGAAGFYDIKNEALFDNWRHELAAWVKSQRNHPSIFIWSIENEISFINGHVYGNDAVTTAQMAKTWDFIKTIDPTRPVMTDGGNADLDESLPVYGGHYMEPPFNSLPQGAYDKAGFAHRQVWPITQAKPIFLGEAFYSNGTDPGDLATIGGEAAFVGKAEADPAISEIDRILSEGYRWIDINFHIWGDGKSGTYYKAWQPVALICKDYDWTFQSGQKVTRTVGIFNDTHDDTPIDLAWSLTFNGKTTSSPSTRHAVPEGGNDKFDIVLPMPTVASRSDGVLKFTLSRKGLTVFSDTREVSVLNTEHMASQPTARPASAQTAQAIAVYDPAGVLAPFLHAHNIRFQAVPSLEAVPATAKLLIVGANALTAAESTSSALAAWASTGRTVIVLEQTNALRYKGLPQPMDMDANHGSVAFVEDLGDPIMTGLEQKDFFTWAPDGYVYRNAYVKPDSGGISIVQCDNHLSDTALVKMQAGKGLLILSQLLVEEKLTTSPVAAQVLENMISYGLQYKQTFRPVTAAVGSNEPLETALKASGLQYQPVPDALAAISKPGSVAVVEGSPENMQALVSNSVKTSAFTAAGGWIVLNDVGPASLADFDKLVHVDHIMRPFKQEKVTWPAVRNRLTSGLAASNIAIGSGKKIFGWSSGDYPDTNAFSYVVDFDDVAPFATSSFGSFANIVNNYTMNDGFWPLIINFAVPADGSPATVPISLQRPETITEFTWCSDTNYEGTTKIALVANGKTLSFDTTPTNDVQTFPVSFGAPVKDLTLEVTGWTHDPKHMSGDGKELIGIDNIWIKVARPADFDQKVKPMLNVGALVEYPQGAGGIILCNVKFADTEANPENVGKKRAIIATILRNLDAPFTGGKTVIAGSGLTYAPIDISKNANQFRTDKGWFGDANFTFADLPTGTQRLAGTTSHVYDFTTSPVPTVVMLGGNRVPGNLPQSVTGIAVNKKADALFFLQAARIDQPRSDRDIKAKKMFEMADYVVHYADGQTVTIPLREDMELASYKQPTPTPLPSAQIAWTKPYAGTDQSAVAYSFQWDNPRPNVAISTIDLQYGPDRRGVPVLLALTAANSPL
jgi:beta-galactosidase